jgi:GntR family transcriptional regulator
MTTTRRSAALPDSAPAPAQVQVARSRPLDTVRQPLYASLARTLIQDIDQERFPVGSLLPPEGTIAQRYGVSRHTVRQALRELREEGLITAQRGIGTRVRARSESPQFFSGVNTVDDLLQFVESTEMQVIGRKEIVADAEFARDFHCKPGQAWVEVDLLRKLEKQPLGYVQAFLRPEHADAMRGQKVFLRPVYSVIEERYGVRIAEVLQEITAANLTQAMARVLKTQPGTAAMRITRYFLDRTGSVIEISVGHYPSGLYTQRSRFRALRTAGEETARKG